MKKYILFLISFLCLQLSIAQIIKNDQGLFCQSNGDLFTGLLKQNLENNQVSQLNILNGKEDGEANYFYASGELMEKGYFTEGKKQGEWLRYSVNGKLIGIANYLNGIKHGVWQVMNENGNKLFEMNYDQGEKSGTWQQWDFSGKLIQSTNYGIKN